MHQAIYSRKGYLSNCGSGASGYMARGFKFTRDSAFWGGCFMGGCIGHATVPAGVPPSALLDGNLTVRPVRAA